MTVSARIKIMVVDDEPLVLKLTRRRLESAGYEVVLRSEALGTRVPSGTRRGA
jgi:CheY-like chemotaxis protein